MRKLILALALLLIPLQSVSFADHWVYVRTTMRSGLSLDDDKGRSKDWDIIDITKATPNNEPTAKEKEQYLIFKVVGDIDKFDESLGLLTPWVVRDPVTEEIIEKKAHRKRKFNYKKFAASRKKGIVPGSITKAQFLAQVKDRTPADLNAFRIAWVKNLPKNLLALADQRIGSKAYAASVSTINKTGEDYNTPQLWEDALDGVLSGIVQGDLYDDDGDLSGRCLINGSTTTATDYMLLTSPVGERHDGTDNGAATMTVTTRDPIVEISDDYSRVTYIIFDYNVNSGGCCRDIISIDNQGVHVAYNIIHHTAAGLSDTIIGIQHETGSGANAQIYNNQIYDLDCGANDCSCIFGDAGDDGTDIYNNTLNNCDDGIRSSYNDSNIYNNLVNNSRDDYLGDMRDAYNNWSDGTDTPSCIGTCSGNINTNTTGWDDVAFVDEANDDFHLAAQSGQDKGPWDNANSAKPGTLSDDIDSETRSDWDIGADEEGIAASSSPAQIIKRSGPYEKMLAYLHNTISGAILK